MKKKLINAATCDAREVTEESLAGFEQITINAALLIVSERSKALLERYPVTINAASVIKVPDDERITLKSINGKGEIGPDADGTDVFLMVNGKLLITDGSADAVKSYYRIIVNGKVLMPRSMEGRFSNFQINGKTEYYPDGASILKDNTVIDDLFIRRAANANYYASGTLFLLDPGIDTDALLRKDLKFAAQKIVMAESLVAKLASQIDEEAEIVGVPDGTAFAGDDLELNSKAMRKYGNKLCVTGDVSILDGGALASLEYLYAAGTVRIAEDLKETFDKIESVYEGLKVIDPNQGLLSDRPLLKVGAEVLKKYPHGVRIEDCAKVTLSDELSHDDIIGKLHISDCAIVSCTKAQEEAVHMIAEDVAMIRVAGQDPEEDDREGMLGGILGDVFGNLKDTQVINAAEYRM